MVVYTDMLSLKLCFVTWSLRYTKTRIRFNSGIPELSRIVDCRSFLDSCGRLQIPHL